MVWNKNPEAEIIASRDDFHFPAVCALAMCRALGTSLTHVVRVAASTDIQGSSLHCEP